MMEKTGEITSQTPRPAPAERVKQAADKYDQDLSKQAQDAAQHKLDKKPETH